MNNFEEKLNTIVLISSIAFVTMFVFFLEAMNKLEKRISKLEESKISEDDDSDYWKGKDYE